MKIPLLFLLLTAAAVVNAETYYLTAVGAFNAHLPASWNTSMDGTGTPAVNFNTNGDTFIVPSGIIGVVNGNMLVGSENNGDNWTMDIDGKLVISNGSIIRMQNYKSGGTIVHTEINVYGTIEFEATAHIMNNDIAAGAQGRVFNLFDYATITTSNPNGLKDGILGSLCTHLTINLSEFAIYEFIGDEQTTNGLPLNVFALGFAGTGAKHLAQDVNCEILGILTFDVMGGPQIKQEKMKVFANRLKENQSIRDLQPAELQILSKELFSDLKINKVNTENIRQLAKADAAPLFLEIAPGQTVDVFVVINVFDEIDEETGERLYDLGSAIKILADSTDQQLPNGTLLYQFYEFPLSATVQFYSNAFIDRSDPENPDYKWQYFGIPFEEFVPEWYLGPYKKYRWDETFENETNWQIVGTNETMVKVQGYAITQDTADIYELRGYLTNEPIENYPLTYTDFSTDYPGQHILSNPFTAPVPIETITFYNTDESVAFYQTGSINDWTNNVGATSDGTMPGQYLNVPLNLAGTDDLPSDIQSMQGFLVKANQFNQSTIRPYNPAARVTGVFSPVPVINIPYPTMNFSGEVYAPKAETEKIFTRIDIQGNTMRDKVWLFTEPSCTKDFDNGWDSRKIMGSSAAPQLYFVENDYKFQVSTMDDINGSFLGFRKGVDSEYTMTFTHSNTELAYPNGIYLIDLVAGKTVDISESGSTYNFVETGNLQAKMQKIASTLDIIRFKVVTSPGTITDISNSEMLIKVFASDRNIIVDNKTASQAELVMYDVAGKVIMRKSIGAGISTIQADIPAGTYIAQVTAEQTNVKSTIILK